MLLRKQFLLPTVAVALISSGSKVAVADPAAAVVPAAPPATATAFTPSVNLYGFVLPTFLFSSAGVESFSQPNFSAFTAAGNPVFQYAAQRAQSSFQVAQSRFGLLAKTSPETTARLELDFIDFAKATPTTAALPRLRRATVEWRARADILVRLGQDWDLVSPLNPHTFNPVGNYFEAGNIAFQRIQAQVIATEGAWEHGFALGMPSNNNSPSDGALEITMLPTLAGRERYKFSSGEVGASALVSAMREQKSTNARLFAGALNVFSELSFGSSWQLRAEAYVGQNTANIGMLGLAFGNAAHPNVREAGGYVTMRHMATEMVGFFGGVGFARILNPQEMLVSYTNAPTGPTLAGTGPGIERNITLRVGADWRAAPSLQFFTEVAGMATRHHLLPVDSARVSQDRSAVVGQMGAQLTF